MKKFLLLAAVLLTASFSSKAEEVTPPAGAVYEYYNAATFIYLTYEDTEWQATVAIAGDKMYIKDVMPYFTNAKWIEGTIDDNTVTFPGGQIIGDLDLSLIDPELTDVYQDCRYFGITSSFTKGDATFSWDAATKTLKLTDYESGADQEGMPDDECLIATDGWSDPDCVLTFTGTGETPTAVESVATDTQAVKAVKVIENGQVTIIRNGAKFNVMGQMIK